MSGRDNDVVVNILSGGLSVTKKALGNVLLFTADQTFATATVKSYTEQSEVNADDELGTTAVDAGEIFFKPEVHPELFKVGKSTAAYAAVDDDLDAIRAADDNWYYLVCGSRAKAVIEEVADWAAVNGKLFSALTEDADVINKVALNIAETLKGDANGRVALLYGDADEFGDVAWASVKGAANPDETSTTWRHATLPGVTVSTLSGSQHSNCDDQYCNTYELMHGVPVTGKGYVSSGSRIDTLIAHDWLKARLEEDLAQMLADYSARNEKIPKDEEGLSVIEGVIRDRTDTGERLGHLAKGSTKIILPLVSSITARAATFKVRCMDGEAIEEITINVGVVAV